ncbi:MAG: alanine--glyoxylate aminotransferase family protein [Planctomycetota bacterium]
MSDHRPRLFIPGPTEVFPEILAALAQPVISHRGPEIAEVTRDVFEKLGFLFRTRHECFVALSAATGLMESAVRNLVGKRLLVAVCGAFSERMYKVAQKNGVPCDALEVEWGRHVSPAAIEEALATGKYDVVAVVHSETSTGVLNPIAEIGEVVRRHEDVLLVSDVVSSLGGARFEMDEWGVDLAFAGTQKCIALPPGLCVFAVSPRAMTRCESRPDRGHYFDFMNFRKMAEKGQSPATINTSMMVALRLQLHRMVAETMEHRWKRHQAMADLVRTRLGDRFALFPENDFMTPSETVYGAPEGLDVAALVAAVREKGKLFGDGYGILKGRTFRIGHMGDLQVEHVAEFLEVFEATLADMS